MNQRFLRIGVVVALFIISQPAAAHVSLQTAAFEPGASLQATSDVLSDNTADRVLGQAGFDSNGAGTSAWQMNGPAGIAIVPPVVPNSGRLFVVEYDNHRVLSWPSAISFANGDSADLVIGQPDFNSGAGALAQNRFYHPEAAVVDPTGSLWVADTENNRVLRFDPPFFNGMNASLVLGQVDFDHNGENQGLLQPAANSLYYPRGLAMDTGGSLYVADDANHRVLRFSPPFNNNMAASLVIGQADFVSGADNRGGAAGQGTLNHPKGITIDAFGNLYVADYENNRVTRYSQPFSNGMLASGVFGQPDFTTIGENTGGIGPGSLYHPVDVAISRTGDVLFITDQGNVRVLGYVDPLNDTSADEHYGQPDFYSAVPNNGGISAASINFDPLGLAVDAYGNLYHADYRNNRLLAYDLDVVGNGTPESCTEAALDVALVNGGNISFNCGTAQVYLTGSKYIAANTTLDGAGTITLSGQNLTALFYIDPAASLTLNNIILTDGYGIGDGGAIWNDGTLIVENSTIRDSESTASGGAIVSYGTLTITNSLLEGNTALNGGALYPRWTNSYTVIYDSVLRDNHATDLTDGWGGAILIWDDAYLAIEGSEIYGNSAQDGGAIYVFENSFLSIDYGTVRDNTATSSGGAIYNDGAVVLEGVTLNSNDAVYGGALYNSHNAFLYNSTFSANSAEFDGGGLDNWGNVEMTNVTMSGNSANSGGSIWNLNTLLTRVMLKNSIIANSPSGGNCSGDPLTSDNADRYSISSDNTCALAGTGSMNAVDPLLTALGNYGGPTQVHMLQPESPAIDAVVGSDAPSTDQRGVRRPQGNGYDIGAVEVTESDYVKRIYLPLMIR